MKLHLAYQSLALLAGLTAAAPSFPPVDLAEVEKRASTCNTASDRACWTDGFNISTDYELSTPTTGVTRTVSPHGPCASEDIMEINNRAV